MSAFSLTLIKRETVAEGTGAFLFTKPAGFDFNPGQAVELILPGAADAEVQDVRHAFSIVSAPFQAQLEIATRMRDSTFKNALNALPLGATVQIDGPFGELRLHDDAARPAVFIAGGIGITPFVSMLRQARHDGLQHRITLLYANRRPEDTAFLDELQELDRALPTFKLIGVMSAMQQSARPWQGRTGLIDAALIKTVAGFYRPVYYLVGPPPMVEAMRTLLVQLDVAADDVREERFSGY